MILVCIYILCEKSTRAVKIYIIVRMAAILKMAVFVLRNILTCSNGELTGLTGS